MRAAVLSAFVFSSCVTPAPRSTLTFAIGSGVAATARVDSVILVTLDGTRWQDIFAIDAPEDLMPTLHKWMTTDGVAFGAPGHGEVWASGPNYVSLPGYTEIMTGRPSACQSNECARVRLPTLVDQVVDNGGTAAVVGSWETLERAVARDPSRVPLSVGRHVVYKGAELGSDALAQGSVSPPWPGSADYRPDAWTARVAETMLDRLPSFLFVGLGDPDEYGHHGDRQAYLASLRAADAFLAEIEKHITERTVVIVTTDHGRAASFRDHGGGWRESGRSWIVVRAPCLSARGRVDAPTLHLANIAPTVRCLLGLPGDDSPVAATPLPAVCSD